ncbi:hypothetical protein V2S66_21065 [Streptomyces sp. V4-01]|uniref:PspA-associated domain-containing protein n=1 Tax=Actinacidiphila polyblastidii TaxID=3110430 RepID=A0ABU7PF64_9ACTN|nr:hypothetical protein [Streptomyces sp. V4-01]
MIVRILGEGQWQVDDEHLQELNVLDGWLEQAVEDGDGTAFAHALTALLYSVRDLGTRLPAERIVPSELILPDADATMERVRELLAGDGLIPG